MSERIKTIIAIIFLCLIVYVLIKYANTPLSDVPLWVAWLLRR